MSDRKLIEWCVKVNTNCGWEPNQVPLRRFKRCQTWVSLSISFLRCGFQVEVESDYQNHRALHRLDENKSSNWMWIFSGRSRMSTGKRISLYFTEEIERPRFFKEEFKFLRLCCSIWIHFSMSFEVEKSTMSSAYSRILQFESITLCI